MQAKDIDDFIQDTGYGIANLLGLGEQANKLVNWLRKLINKNYDPDQSMFELISLIRKTIGNKPIEYTNAINKIDKALAEIDSKASNLPLSSSQNIRNITRNVRAKYRVKRSKLLQTRGELSRDLYKVENSMNQALNQATMQDSISHSRKQENQKQIQSLLDSTPKGPSAETVERKITDV
jgi:hypothetical protein